MTMWICINASVTLLTYIFTCTVPFMYIWMSAYCWRHSSMKKTRLHSENGSINSLKPYLSGGRWLSFFFFFWFHFYPFFHMGCMHLGHFFSQGLLVYTSRTGELKLINVTIKKKQNKITLKPLRGLVHWKAITKS